MKHPKRQLLLSLQRPRQTRRDTTCKWIANLGPGTGQWGTTCKMFARIDLGIVLRGTPSRWWKSNTSLPDSGCIQRRTQRRPTRLDRPCKMFALQHSGIVLQNIPCNRFDRPGPGTDPRRIVYNSFAHLNSGTGPWRSRSILHQNHCKNFRSGTCRVNTATYMYTPGPGAGRGAISFVKEKEVLYTMGARLRCWCRWGIAF